MTEFAKEIVPVNLEDEMRQSYLDYAMSVIIGRALPDVRERVEQPRGEVDVVATVREAGDGVVRGGRRHGDHRPR